MSTRAFKFSLPINEAQQSNNWKILIDNVVQQEFDPFFGTTPATEGFTNVGDYWGYYFVFGPLVFFSIVLLNDGGGSVRWGAGDILKLPFEAATRGSNLLEKHKSFPATEPTHSGTVQGWFYLQSNTIVAVAAHSSGSSDDTNISGWYFRK
jgi:hypothetical protein